MEGNETPTAPEGSTPRPIQDQDRPAATPVAIADCRCLGLILLIVFSIATCLYGIRQGPTLGDHEAVNALAARDVIETGRWMIPHVSDVPWIRKTPLGIWFIAAAGEVSGDQRDGRPVSEFSARLPSAIAGILNALVVFWLGSMLYGHRGGLVAGFLAAGCAGTIFFAHNAQVEMVLTLFNTLALALFWRGTAHAPHRGYLAAFYVAFALAMMAKAPLPLATVGLSLLAWWFVTLPLLDTTNRIPFQPRGFARRWGASFASQIRGLRSLWLIPGIIIFLVVTGAWPLYVYLNVDNALNLWKIEYLARYSGDLSDKARPVWYYIPIVFAVTFPFFASVPESIAAPFLPRYARNRRGIAFAFTVALVSTVFISTAAFKRPHYIASVLPAFCLLLAPVIERLFFGPLFLGPRWIRAVCFVVVLLLIGATVGGAIYARREFPELMRPGLIAVGGSVCLWCGAAIAFALGRRASSFALLLLGIPLMVIAGDPLVHRVMRDAAPSAKALTDGFVERGIGPSDDILWADSRPNATIEFYSGLRVRRLIDEIELSAMRTGRSSVSAELKHVFARRIADRLALPKPAYIVLSRKYYEKLAQSGDIPHRVLFRVEGLQDDPDDDLVVFTQSTP